MLNPEFERTQKSFFNKHCLQFEATDENKLVYTQIFHEYSKLIEHTILTALTESLPGFDMETFLKQVTSRNEEIDEPLMDLLLSFAEFETFKEMMLFARAHLVATTPKLKSGKAAQLGLSNSVAPPQQVGDKLVPKDMQHFESCIDGLQISGKTAK